MLALATSTRDATYCWVSIQEGSVLELFLTDALDVGDALLICDPEFVLGGECVKDDSSEIAQGVASRPTYLFMLDRDNAGWKDYTY